VVIQYILRQRHAAPPCVTSTLVSHIRCAKAITRPKIELGQRPQPNRPKDASAQFAGLAGRGGKGVPSGILRCSCAAFRRRSRWRSKLPSRFCLTDDTRAYTTARLPPLRIPARRFRESTLNICRPPGLRMVVRRPWASQRRNVRDDTPSRRRASATLTKLSTAVL